MFIPGGAIFKNLTQLSRAGIPTIALVFGNSTAGGAYLPGMSDHVVMIEEQSKVFLAGPPLVKAATGEESDDESLGGAEMHARVSGLADHYAKDEQDAIRIGRNIVKRLNWTKAAEPLVAAPKPPRYDAEELLDIVPPGLKAPFDPREVIARIVDDSDFDEFKPLYGTSLVCGWAQLHGYPVGILANSRGVLFSEESQKAAQFIQLANSCNTPLLFLHNTTGYMVGKEYEQKGIIKHGAMMINAVSNSTVPHISVLLGNSYRRRALQDADAHYDPGSSSPGRRPGRRSWAPSSSPTSPTTSRRPPAESRGMPFDEEGMQAIREMIEGQITAESCRWCCPASSRRRDHRPARHPRRPRHRPVRRSHRTGRGTSSYGIFRM